MIQVEHEREVIQSLSPDEQVYMATLALAGWTFKLKHVFEGTNKWCGTPPQHTEPKFYAPTLFSLLGYIERQWHG